MTMTTGRNELAEPFPLSKEDVQRFRADGFVKLPGVLRPETIGRYEPEITRKLIDLNTQHLPMAERTTYQKAFLQVTNMWPHSDVIREFVHSPRLAKIAADLLEVSSVRLFADQGLYKESGGGITPWHADQYHWPLSSDRSVTVWIPLQPTPLAMGPLSFAVGSHTRDFGRELGISDESEASVQQAVAAAGFSMARSGYELGEVSYHMGWTFHRASPNETDQPRRVMTIIYVDASIRLTQPSNAAHRGVLEMITPGAQAGGLVDSPLNPVLYPCQ